MLPALHFRCIYCLISLKMAVQVLLAFRDVVSLPAIGQRAEASRCFFAKMRFFL